MRGYHAFLKQVPTPVLPPSPVDGSPVAAPDPSDLVTATGSQVATDWGGTPQFVGGRPAPPDPDDSDA